MALERRDVVQWLKSLLCQPNALSSDAQAGVTAPTVNMHSYPLCFRGKMGDRGRKVHRSPRAS